MNQQNQSPKSGSLFQRVENIKWLMRFPALTVMIFFRKDLGYRLVSPLHLFGVTAALAFVSLHMQYANPNGGGEDLMWFSIIAFFLGIIRRAQAWQSLDQGGSVHSFYIGTSPFEFRWLPEFLLRYRRLARFADPLFCIALGLLYTKVSPPLGYWLIFSGLALRAFEDAVYRKELNRDLDVGDGMVMSEVYARSADRFSQPQTTEADESSSLPTGLAPDIEIQIKRRKAK